MASLASSSSAVSINTSCAALAEFASAAAKETAPERLSEDRSHAGQDEMSIRYINIFGGTAFLEFSHQIRTEIYVDTRKWVKSSGETGQFPRFRL